MSLVAPSILSADFAHLADDVVRAEKAGADMLHIDVMDGHFVPNLTIGPQVVASLRPHTGLLFDVHLMIEKPQNLIKHFVDAGADLITVHAESVIHLHRVISEIKDLGVKCGVALNPSTPLNVIEYVIQDLDMVLIMSVNPGFAAQGFLPLALEKIQKLKVMVNERSSRAQVQVDGGINASTGFQAARAGADILVAGSFVFGSQNLEEAIALLKAM